MKVFYENEVREARRCKDCSPESVRYSSVDYLWDADAIFVKPKSKMTEWIYVYDSEVEIIEESN